MSKHEDDLPEIEIIDLNEPKPRRSHKRASKRNREYVRVTYLVVFMLLALAVYFCWFLGFQSESFINSSYNRRLVGFSDKVIRGDIITRDGVVLATSELDGNGNEIRSYPQGRKYAHVTGFNTRGMAGLEKAYNFQLLRSHSFIIDRLSKEVAGEKTQGDTVVSTIDSRLQSIAYERLGGYRGAVIAMDPDTGEVLCMVSKPDFDPGSIEANWESLSADESSSVLINRATQGLYPPGSTFKIITALSYLRQGGSGEDMYNCPGYYEHNGNRIRCYHGTAHGDESFRLAFAKSCNSVFAQISLGLSPAIFNDAGDDLLINKGLNTLLGGTTRARFGIDGDEGEAMMMQTGIGQGNTLVTPVHMLMLAGAIENKGVAVKPRLVKEIQNDGGAVISRIKRESYGSVMSRAEADILREYMRTTVEEGTATRLQSDRYTAYGKTGTAEFSSNSDEAHSWFVGFAENEGKKIAISVIMEKAGSGSDYAVPLTREIFDAYFAD